MSATEHLCQEHPTGRSWQPGPVKDCPHHERQRNAPRVRMGRKERAAIDKAAGKVGTDRSDTYGYMDGGEGW